MGLHIAQKLIVQCNLTFDERVVIHRVDAGPAWERGLLLATSTTRRITTLASKVILPYAVNLRALCRANLVAQRLKIRTKETHELHRVVRVYRSTSLTINSPPLWEHHRALGIVLLQGPRGALCLMSEVPLYGLGKVKRSRPQLTSITPTHRAISSGRVFLRNTT